MLLASSRGCDHCNCPWESLLEFLAVPAKTWQDLALYLFEEGCGTPVHVCLLVQGAVWQLCCSVVSVELFKSPAGLSLCSPEAGAWLEEVCSMSLVLLARSTSDHRTLKRFLACPKGMFYLDRAHTFKVTHKPFWTASHGFLLWCACFPWADSKFFSLGVPAGQCLLSSFLHVPTHTSLSK